jgi:AraC-like DNA-binding protein
MLPGSKCDGRPDDHPQRRCPRTGRGGRALELSRTPSKASRPRPCQPGGQGSLDRQPPPPARCPTVSSAATISRRDRAPTPAAHRHAPGRAVADHRTGGPVRAQRAHAVSPVRGLHRPRAYLQQAPVEQAKRLLETASDQIDQVRRGVGYSDPVAFRRVFKQATGLPPRATAMLWTSQPLGQLNAGTSRQLSLTLPLPDNSPAIPSAGRLPTS